MDPRFGRFCLSSTLCHAFICCLLDSLQGKKQLIPLKWRSWSMNSRFIYDLSEWIVVEVLFIDSDKGTNWRRRKCVHWHSDIVERAGDGREAAGVVSGCQAEASRAALNTDQLVVQQLWSEGEERKGATLPDFSNNNSQPTPLGPSPSARSR